MSLIHLMCSSTQVLDVSNVFSVMAHELLIIEKCNAGVGIFINLICFYNERVSTKLVFETGHLKTFDSQYELAAIKNMIRNWIGSKIVVSLQYLAANHGCGGRWLGCWD